MEILFSFSTEIPACSSDSWTAISLLIFLLAFAFLMSVVFATGARDGNVMVWDMRCNRRPGHFYQPINVISNAHFERLPGTRQMSKKKSRRSTSRPVMVCK